MLTPEEIFDEVMNLRNDLLSSKNIIDQSAEVKTSRRLQGAITRCGILLSKLQKNVVKETNRETGSDR